MTDRRIQLTFSLEQFGEMAATLVQVEEVIGKAIDTLEEISGLPLREAANCMDRKPGQPCQGESEAQTMGHNPAGESWPLEDQTP